MALNFTKSAGKKIAAMDTGAFPARIVQIIDLGIQENEYQGKVTNVHKVYITYEFPTETIEINGEERPRWLSREYVISMSETAALYKLVHAVDPKGEITKNGTNVKALLGLPLSVTVGRTASGNAKVSDVGPLMKGMTVPELANSPAFFDLDGSDVKLFENLPPWLKDKITSGPDFEKTNFSGVLMKVSVDDIQEDVPY